VLPDHGTPPAIPGDSSDSLLAVVGFKSEPMTMATPAAKKAAMPV
jgi:hypothetical protein